MKNINAALLSFGMSGHVFHAPFIHLHPGFTLLGSWERSKKAIQQYYPNVRSYESMETVLSDDSVDLVVVNTPTLTHYEYVKKALEAGKHVVVEKAFTDNAKEAIELQQLADAKNLKLCVFQNRRWDSDFKTVKEVVEKGLLGEMVETTFSYARYVPELSPKTHKENPGPGAGIVHDLGPHLIDQALFLYGMPNSVFADIAITRPTSQVADYFDILMNYDTHRVHLKAGYYYREPVPSFVVHGTKGSFLKIRGDVQEDQLKLNMKPNDPKYGIESTDLEGLLHTEIEGKVIREKIRTHAGNYFEYYEGVYQSITNNQPEPVSSKDGVNVMKIIDAAYESAERRVRIEIH